ncbi:CBS domain-containing protein [Streptomyces gobiensis]|uniref:CBS domain-containing protein n=1 Tax=Streptomyces gobiensis TaxID=2875706 RepID=UPI001E35DCC8|nr:CBS domain-containing protein [Streptomyces gobiensis]UGY91253.1 CBS domain-containing protein [Streptomyces gobiensis]
MTHRITDRNEVRRLVKHEAAQLVEVLPRGEYEHEHIAGAVHIPLRELDRRAKAELDPSKPVIVYCNDFLCDMSPRAARRLDHLGFAHVYDYVPGKTDWMAAGLPREGHSAQTPNPGDIAQPTPPTCHFTSPAAEAYERMRAEDHNFCVAVDDDTVVTGMVYLGEQGDADGKSVEQIMRPGPTTVRASEPLQPLLGRMEKAQVDAILVTDPEGRLLGLLDRHKAAAALTQTPAA